MNGFRLVLAAATACAVVAMGSASEAFHDGGAVACDGCHDLHASEEGGATGFLLRGQDPSSTCLRCHAEAGSPANVLSDDGSSYTPGGDFYWLQRSYSWEAGTGDFRPGLSAGESHGHNVVAGDYGLRGAGVGQSPGGSYPASALGCTSCHDPHGATGVGYRLLAGPGYESGGMVFSEAVPVALAPADWKETDDNHVDYGAGMSAWCANCHRDMYGGSVPCHPTGDAGVLAGRTAGIYAAYVRTGDFSGTPDDSYLALVPFERGVTDEGLLDPTRRDGPESGVARVMCLTCHRAHASAFEHAGRWDFSATFLVDSHPRVGDAGATAGDELNSYYGRDLVAEFGPYQRSLCNKCHGMD